MNKLLLLILVIVLVYFVFNNKQESFSQLGALQQLYAKGPQDFYLTTDNEKYMLPVYYGGWGWRSPYRYGVWNQPTRLSKYYDPIFGFYPYY